MESRTLILNKGVKAVFTYGTLRGDGHDYWGVIDKKCRWKRAQVSGFRLYQHPSVMYPFAIQTKDSSDKVVGTLIEFENDDVLV